jgi:hypothetical protein
MKASKFFGVMAIALSLTGGMNLGPAWAVSPNGGARAVSRFNTAGSSFLNLTSSTTTFCYLSTVGFENTDIDGELAMCRLTRGTVVWTLEAVLGKSSDADARCAAFCYNN